MKWWDRMPLYSSLVYSCHLLLISSASVRSMPFLPFIEPTFVWNVPLVSLIFLKRPLIFPILLFSSISLHWSLRKALLLSLLFFGTLHSNGYIFPFLLCFLQFPFIWYTTCEHRSAISNKDYRMFFKKIGVPYFIMVKFFSEFSFEPDKTIKKISKRKLQWFHWCSCC